MRSWLLYIPAGLIEIHPQMKYQLATINRSWDSTLDKNLNLAYGRTDGRTCARTDNPNALCPLRSRGHKNHIFCKITTKCLKSSFPQTIRVYLISPKTFTRLPIHLKLLQTSNTWESEIIPYYQEKLQIKMMLYFDRCILGHFLVKLTADLYFSGCFV